MRIFRAFALGLLVLGGLAGCAATGPQSAVQGVQRVAVISAIGDRLQYRQMASVAINNETIAANISDWGFDPYVEGVIAQGLGQQYQVEGVAVDRSQPTASALALAAGASRVGNPLDAYVIVVPVERKHYLSEKTSESMAATGMAFGVIGELMAGAIAGDEGRYNGLGIYRAAGKSAQYVYAIADIVLIDGRTYQELRRTPLYALEPRAGATQIEGTTNFRDMRLMRMAGTWPDAFDQFSSAQLHAVSDEMAVLLRLQVNYSLRQIGLTY